MGTLRLPGLYTKVTKIERKENKINKWCNFFSVLVVRALSCSRPLAPPPPPPSSQVSAPPPPSSQVSDAIAKSTMLPPPKKSGPPRPPTRDPQTRISSLPSSTDDIPGIGDDKPAGNNPGEIPKTGFDFLDEW